MQMCIFDKNKICDNCSDCNTCDLVEGKICDNCGKCLELDSDYKEILIDGIIEDESEIDDYLYEENTLDFEEEDENVLYIEDIPELKEKLSKEYSE
ncbi:hypothetical protein [Caloramator australicus]|uniref:Protein containing Zn-finger domain n=1 Tax=Caloramator australicus RC3 TaxID=857293 RepID=I7K8F0_9CLOT|nr:hypothetical protein [Caloramator australicus]CCJ33825.1 hypothetical protein CAAU_1741 [Caloramator australicus RC3]